MKNVGPTGLFCSGLFCFGLVLCFPLWSQEKVDLETMGRIRYEGFHNSKVMDFATGLMDSIGERLTGSPNMKRANEWTRDQLTAMGLSQRPPGSLGAIRSRLGQPIRQRAHDLARYCHRSSLTPRPGPPARTA